ncbi:MAG: hypothetical protein K2H53_00080 [Clostridia bacterium]|nr:hypothetical protein [Clostridia bacterium]
MPCGVGDQTSTPENTKRILAEDNQYLELRAVSVTPKGDRKITNTDGALGSQLRICTDLMCVLHIIVKK